MEIERSGRCPRCNTPTTAGLRFCPTCGLKLGDAGAGPPVDPFLARVRAALLNEYDVVREIGRGGMAVVFLAHDLRLPRRVALKVMLPELSYSSVMPQRFVGEARTAAMLDHPNIVPVFHAGEQDGLRYFAMRYIDGCSLERLMRARGPLPVTLACHLVAEIAAALDYAHAHGVVHRDVKPANVMLDRRFGRAIVTDFGIARVVDGQRLTGTGLAIGTPEYMSPEQYASEDVTGASDQYALGAVAFQLLTGRPPFVGSQAEVLLAHVREAPPALRTLRPDAPPLIETLVMRMLAKAPGDRWPSLAELGARFTEHVGSAALTLPQQLIALLPEPTAEERLEQTPVSPAAGLARPATAAPATVAPATAPTSAPPAPPEPPPPVAVAPPAPAADGWDDVPARSATFAPYRPVAPAEPEPVAPARRGRGVWLAAGGATAALLIALAVVATRDDPPPPPQLAAAPTVDSAPPPPTPDSSQGMLPPDSLPRPDSAGAAPPDSAPRDPATVRRVRIEPPTTRLTLGVGDTVRLRARLVNGNGSAIATTDVARWTSGAPSAVEVSADGLLRAVAPVRRATVTATIGAERRSLTVRVDAPPTPTTTAGTGPRPPEPPPPPTLPSADEAQQEADAVAGAMRERRVDALRALFDAGSAGGPSPARLLETVARERDLRAHVQATGTPEPDGAAATVPVRVRLSWQRGGITRIAGRDEATAQLRARLERVGGRWQIAALQLAAPFRR